ncbi:hypothetical protein SAMN05192575_104163 [Nocardioides alpinus]|nr:hypothetical protein [Nocardioides alpinus]SFB15783.1 hypothetical protein SAMN05192575_104163 [Nocardioides alpinus]
MSRLRTTQLLPALVAVLALGLSACGAQDTDTGTDTGTDAGTDSASETPTSAAADSTLALTADGSMAGKCAVPSAETLASFDTAFAGTVTSLDGGTATLSVDDWYAGDEAATVTVESPSQDLQDLLMAVDFQEGTTYLVSATDDRVTLCGFTAEETPELRALYDEAFAQ